ncbi:acyl carrier protein [Vibrio brasiliensis]|uniref:acyl carrier protein n=1 Tax=Vibrio brasiliensis TaxID=170652 RepID=UPI001EFE94A6|nr:acyl carrier protein [Vibrio brasiliensis]MCG9753457.1 acyl carrier protein [Vibrio brasiliensis]
MKLDTNVLINLIAEVLELEVDNINESTTSDEVENWDSVSTITLMTVICEEYGVEPSFDVIDSFTSVEKIQKLLKDL